MFEVAPPVTAPQVSATTTSAHRPLAVVNGLSRRGSKRNKAMVYDGVEGDRLQNNGNCNLADDKLNGEKFGHATFVKAFESRYDSIDTALQSLDSLNEQILQFIFSSSLASNTGSGGVVSGLISSFDNDALLPKQRDALTASLTLMRRLLMDAQTKFKKMVDDNRRLASHIDGTILSANQEVNTLRIELDMTNKKLRELTIRDSCQHCQNRRSESREMKKMNEENKRISSENRQLQKEVENLRQQVASVAELSKTKDALQALKTDRLRLREEKHGLLLQIEEMHKTIDDKEDQLRTFIREYQIETQEREDRMSELEGERRRIGQQKDDLLHRHTGASDVISGLRQEITSKDKMINDFEIEISQLKQLVSPAQLQSNKRRSFYVEEPFANHKAINVSTENNLTADSADLLISSPSSPRTFLSNVPCSSSSNEEVNGIGNGTVHPSHGRNHDKANRKKTKLVTHLSGSLSRAWGRARNRKSLDISNPGTPLTIPRNVSFSVGSYITDPDVFLSASHVSLCDRTEEEKKEILEESKTLPMHKWKADTVQVWLEIVMHMSQYSKDCAENVKSGKVLLGMTDEELESCLNITNPLHCRKLRLAIEEFQNPAVTISNMSPAGQLDHWWVSEHCLMDIGLAQYASSFRKNLVDGRVLGSLTRKDLERYLGMEGKKSHQDSILRTIELLTMLGFDRQRLDDRRQMCQSCDADLVVWNNNRLIQWAKAVDLKEYASNLRESGVHGALLVLEPTYSSDDLATALGIPAAKPILRRHLATEFEALVMPARDTFREENGLNGNVMKKCSSSLSQSFLRSADQTSRSRRSLRSISRSFGRHLGRDYHTINGTDRISK